MAADSAWLQAIRERDTLARVMFVDELSVSAKDRQRLLEVIDDAAGYIMNKSARGEEIYPESLLEILEGHS